MLLALRLPTWLRHTVGELRYEGRLTGRRVALPVSLARVDDMVIVRVARAETETWWRDFRTPHPLSIRVDGAWLSGSGRVVLPGTMEHEEMQAWYERGHPRERVSESDPYVVVQVNHAAAPDIRNRLWQRWFRAVTLGEFLGLLAPALAGALTVNAAPAVTAGAMLAAGAVEGAVLGRSQAGVLRPVLRGFAPRDWIVATMVAAVAAWAVGLVPMLYGDHWPEWPPAALVPVVVAGASVIVFSLGVAQWFVLRYWTTRAWWWIWANVLGWGAGLGTFALVTTPLWQPGQSAALVAAIGAVGGLAMAAAMAAVTGAFLVRILAAERTVTP
ncbi:hypothetical protein GCM10027089_59570 [Nocardia thraciensis]